MTTVRVSEKDALGVIATASAMLDVLMDELEAKGNRMSTADVLGIVSAMAQIGLARSILEVGSVVGHIDETEGRNAALAAWSAGQGRHPDD